MNNYLFTFPRLAIVALAAALLLPASIAKASVIDLGDAAGFSVLTYNTSNVSDSAFQGGPMGWSTVTGNKAEAPKPTPSNRPPCT